MDLQVFTHSIFGDIRIVHDEEGEPMFTVRDVCTALGLRNISQTVKRLHEEDVQKRVVHTTGGAQETWFTNEAGLYNMIFMSRRKEAIAFRRWVTSEVLPAIRKTGEYRLARKVYMLERPIQLGGGYVEVPEEGLEEHRLRLMDQWFEEMDERFPELFGGKSCMKGGVPK